MVNFDKLGDFLYKWCHPIAREKEIQEKDEEQLIREFSRELRDLIN